MTGGPQGGPVLVAVGDDDDGHAVDWAAAEASARRCALHIVHVTRLRWAVDPSGFVPVADFWSYRVAAERVLEAAVRRACSVASDLAVSAQVTFGATVPSLVSHSSGAQLLVLGSRSTTPLTRGIRGLVGSSVCARVATSAHCPVAVVRPLRGSTHTALPLRVVVGVDGAGAGAETLGVAFRAAAQRGLPLVAVHALTPHLPADHAAVFGSAPAAEQRAGIVLDGQLAPWRRRFPDVPVDSLLTRAEAAVALVRESATASLVVVGSRGRGTVRSRLFGSVSRQVIQRAGCPVVVVARPGTVRRHGHAEPARRTAVPITGTTGTAGVERRSTTSE